MSDSTSSSAPAPAAAVTDTSTAQAVDAQAVTPAEIRKMKLKVDGVESEYGEDEVIRYAQQGKAANKRFEEAATMRREAEQMVNLIKRDPRAVLEDPRIGLNFRQIAEEYLADQLKS